MIPSSETISRAKVIIDTLESLQAQLAGLFGGTVVAPAAAPAAFQAKRRGRPPGKAKVIAPSVAVVKGARNMSAEGRARMGAAAKARWAKVHAAQGKTTGAATPTPAVKVAKKAGKMSAAGRANIIAAQKARWAKIRAEKKSAK